MYLLDTENTIVRFLCLKNIPFLIKDVYHLIQIINISRSEQNGAHLADDMSEYVFCETNVYIINLIQIALKFVYNGSISNGSSLVQTMD